MACCRLGEKNDGFKDLVTSTVGNAAMLGHGLTGDAVLKNSFVATSYAPSSEALRPSLQEEKSFGEWMGSHIEELTRSYATKAASGEDHAPA